MKKSFVISILLAIFASTAIALDIPALSGRVNDYAKVLQSEQKAALEKQLADFESQTSNQLVVLTVDTLQGEPIENYSIKVAEKWKIGQDKKDNGVILVVAVKDRKLRIEVGYGLEGALTDALSKMIIENEIVPSFKSGNFAAGITAGVDAIIKATRNEYQPEKKGPANPRVFFFLLFLIPFFIAAFLQDDGKYAAGTLVGGAISAGIGFWMFGIIGAIVAGIVGCLICSFARVIVEALSDGGGYSGGGGSSSSSGGGGFSGGGGDFGGGGASGSW